MSTFLFTLIYIIIQWTITNYTLYLKAKTLNIYVLNFILQSKKLIYYKINYKDVKVSK